MKKSYRVVIEAKTLWEEYFYADNEDEATDEAIKSLNDVPAQDLGLDYEIITVEEN